MIVRTVLIVVLFSLFGEVTQAAYTTHRKSQFVFVGGVDIPDEDKTNTSTTSSTTEDPNKDRETNAGFTKITLQTRPKWFRFSAAATFIGGSEYLQAEFNLGFYIYPLAYLFRKGPIQAFFFAEGSAGAGRFNEQTRFDIGYEAGAGGDFRMGKKWGFTVGGSVRNATEKSFRAFGGIFYQK